MTNYITGFSQIMNPLCLPLGLLGTFLSIFLGVNSGMIPSMGITLVLPPAYSMGIVSGMSLLLGIYIGSISEGLIMAILINISSAPASVATASNGHPMALQGEGSRTIRVGTLYLFLGDMVSLAALFLVSPILARRVFKLNYEKYFSTAVLSLLLISSLSDKPIAKGSVSTLIGVIFITIGMAPADTTRRYASGLTDLDSGLRLLPLMIDIYVVAEVLKIATASDQGDMKPLNYRSKGLGVTWKEFREQFKDLTASSLLGVRIGILPGLGATISDLIAYPVSKKMSKHPERYGVGYIDSLITLETVNNAVSGRALISLLTMGIPGDAGAIMLLAALMLENITPGPLLFDTYSDIIYAMFVILIVTNITMFLIQTYGLPVSLKLLSIPKDILLPAVMVLASIGALTMNNRVFDVWFILFFAIVRYGLNWLEFPPTPIMLGSVLGPIVELNFRRGMMSSYGTFFNSFTRPIFGTVLMFTILLLIIQIVRTTRTRQKTKVNL